MPSRTRKIVPNTPLHRMIAGRLSSRYKMADQEHTKKTEKWRKAEDTMLAYIPETDADRARSGKRDGGVPTYTTIQIPYTYALVMTAHTYMTSVMLSRNPVHQFAGWNGQGENESLALETLMNYQTVVGGALPVYYIWLYDVIKYGVGVIGEYWDKETIQFGELVDLAPPGSKKPQLEQVTKQAEGYQGLRRYNVSPFDFMHDPRVPIGQFQTGEFCMVRRRIAWNDLLRRGAQGYYTNLEEVKRAGAEHTSQSQANGESSQLVRPDYFLHDGDESSKHPAVIDAIEAYVDLVPSEWGVGTSNFPEKWVFSCTSDFTVIFGASPHGAAHGKFPFDVGEIEIEGYGAFNRGIPEIMEPIQNTVDWLVNAHFFNVRASLNNQFIVDPSRVYLRDIQKSSAGFVWRLRPEAYGTPVDAAIKQFPVHDVTANHMNDMDSMLGVGQRMLGISDQIMGMLEPGGRKSATEIRTATGFGVNRLKTGSEYFGVSAFSPHAIKGVITTQQYFDVPKKLRIVGDQAMFAGENFVNVDPTQLAGMWDYVPVDGTLPVDRFAQITLWKDMLAQVGALPQVQQQFDIGKIFAWMMQMGGIRNVEKFKIQVLPPGMAPGAGALPMPGAPPGPGTTPMLGPPPTSY